MHGAGRACVHATITDSNELPCTPCHAMNSGQRRGGRRRRRHGGSAAYRWTVAAPPHRAYLASFSFLAEENRRTLVLLAGRATSYMPTWSSALLAIEKHCRYSLSEVEIRYQWWEAEIFLQGFFFYCRKWQSLALYTVLGNFRIYCPNALFPNRPILGDFPLFRSCLVLKKICIVPVTLNLRTHIWSIKYSWKNN